MSTAASRMRAEGTSALKWDEASADTPSGRIIAFPGASDRRLPRRRCASGLLEGRSVRAVLRKEHLLGTEFEGVSRKAEVAVGIAFSVIGLLFVLIGA